MMIILLAPFAFWGLLLILSEYGSVPLKPLKPWLIGVSWVLWAGGFFGLIKNSRWQFGLFSAYFATGLVLGWINKRYLFVSNVKPIRSLASVLTVPQPTYVAVRRVSTASAWYVEKFGLRELSPTEEIGPEAVALKFNEGTYPIILTPRDPLNSRSVPVFFTRNIAKARSRLNAVGINTGPLQRDRQGTQLFELIDGEGNTLEVCERA
jgi:hypothetical protein